MKTRFYNKLINLVESTPLCEVENTKNGTETLLIGKVEDIRVKSAMKDGVLIDKYYAAINLKDSEGSIEFIIFQDHLQQLEEMDLSRNIAFEVMITDFNAGENLIKKIHVLEILYI